MLKKLAILSFAFYSLTLSNFAIADDQKDQDFPLLYSQFGEFCTMCEAVVSCTVDGVEDETLYHLRVRPFMDQIFTIWEWFNNLVTGEPLTGHVRPVDVYMQDSGRWSKHTTGALLSLEPDIIEIDDTRIDRNTHIFTANGQSGICTREDLWPAIERLNLINQEQGNE